MSRVLKVSSLPPRSIWDTTIGELPVPRGPLYHKLVVLVMSNAKFWGEIPLKVPAVVEVYPALTLYYFMDLLMRI